MNAERLPAGLAERVDGKTGKRWKVVKGAGLVHLVTQYAAPASDGVRFLELGKLPGGVEPSVTVAFRHVKERFRRPGWAVVADLAAGTRQAMFGWACFGLGHMTDVLCGRKYSHSVAVRKLTPHEQCKAIVRDCWLASRLPAYSCLIIGHCQVSGAVP